MIFDDAKDVRMPFGEYNGMTLDEIAQTDAGLLYLDRLIGWDKLYGRIKEAITVYLANDVIKKEIERLT